MYVSKKTLNGASKVYETMILGIIVASAIAIVSAFIFI